MGKFIEFKKPFIPYKKQLQHHLWHKKSDEIKERDFYRCNNCNSHTELEVHHIIYKKNTFAWEYPNNYLITLCNFCHENEHKEYFGKENRLSKYALDIKNKTELFPIFFNGKKLYKKDCHQYFLDVYEEINTIHCYDENEQGIYLCGGVFIRPDGELI